jgi:adenylate cyclase
LTNKPRELSLDGGYRISFCHAAAPMKTPSIKPNFQFSLAGMFAAVALFTTLALWLLINIGLRDALRAWLNRTATVVPGIVDPFADGVFEQQYLLVFVVACLGVGAAGILVGIFLARLIGKPLTLLMRDMLRLQRLDLDNPSSVRSMIGEIQLMENTLDSLRSGLRSFRRYVPADLVTELFSMHREAVLGMEKRELTVYFGDIADFTALSESTAPERLVEELRVYFESLTRAIIERGGTIDKYMGDTIMAFWGAPSPLANHAEAACRAALQCQSIAYGLSQEWVKKGLPPLRVRIGLHTGEMLVGNIGYAERLNYTVIGDNVNIGSRLEGLNKYYGTDILLTESTFRAAEPLIEARLLDIVVVKGKTQGIKVYELVGERGSVSGGWLATLDLYSQGMYFYLARDWTKAAGMFAQAIRHNPQDRPAALMLERATRFSRTPPPEDWKGDVIMRDK